MSIKKIYMLTIYSKNRIILYMQNRLIIFFILFLLGVFFIYPQSPDKYIFDSLTLEEGLSNLSVSSIQQDSKGFLWFGTQSGLNRYDGYEFTQYNHDIFDENSLPHGLVQSLFIDENDIIWIGTYNGISRFDPSKSEFTNYEYLQNNENSLSNNIVTAIVKDHRGYLWIATLGGLNKFDTESGLFTRYLHNPDIAGSLMNDTIRSLLFDTENRLWVGNFQGIDLYSESSDAFIHYPYDAANPSKLPSPYVMKIIEGNENQLLLGTWGGGLTKFDPITESFENVSLGDNRVYSMEIDKDGLVWLGTWGGGIFVFNSADESIINLKSDELNATSISSDTVYSLFRDNSGIMWVGTNGQGINKHNSYKKDYKFLSHNIMLEETMGSGKVETMMKDRNGDLWIGIYNGGLNRYNPLTHDFKDYRHDENNSKSISNDIVSDILQDQNGKIWIATNEGINIYETETDSFSRLYLDPLEDRNVSYAFTDIYEDKTGNIWIGSHNKGLFQYNPVTEEVIHYSNDINNDLTLSDNLVYSILERENGELWIGTNKGLNLMNRQSGTFKRYLLDRSNPMGINSNAVRVLLEDSTDILWIGTGGGGINRYNDNSENFSHYTTKEGLSNNFIMSMKEGLDDTIWAGTKEGISIIDKTKGIISTIGSDEGLEISELTNGSMTDSDNNLYFGSISMIYRFTSIDKKTRQKEPEVHIDSIKVGNKTITYISPYLKPADVILEYNNSNYLSFHVVALNFFNPENTIYTHILEGFDDDWIYDSTSRDILYTNLQPGNYQFRIKASTGKDQWIESEIIQKVHIKAPPWRTWWAYLFYVLLLTSLIYMLVRFRMNVTKIQRYAELERAEKRYKQLNNYLSNILNSMPSILIGVNDHLIITQWNGGAEKVTGISEDSAKGGNLREIYPSLPMKLKQIENSLKTGVIHNERKRINAGDTNIKYVDITVYPINTDGITEAIIRIDDVTTRVQLEETLIQSEKMLSIGGLAAGMAHEINNPLAGMIQNASVLRSRLALGRKNQANEKSAQKADITIDSISTYMEDRNIPVILDKINESGKRISEIVANMLSFAQKRDSLKELQNMAVLIDKTIELAASDYDLKKQYDFKSISIVRDFQDPMPMVLCESSKIQQVILNILRNGAEAMSEADTESPRFSFKISSDETKGKALIEIENNGPGIEEKVRKRIFEPFYTTKPIGVGTGLGLSISYFIIVENHMGKIKVESSSRSGVKFIIQLPL